MSLYANVAGERQRATREGPRAAECQDCGQPMIAKTGDVKIWHWAHRSENPDCQAAGETEWHLDWKELGPPGSQERAVGNRRADVLAPGGFAVEFQKSALTGAEVLAREADWKRQLVWIFDAAAAYGERRLELRVNLARGPGDAYRNIRWAHAPERVKAATCTTLLDLGDQLIYVGKWYDHSPLQGYGWLITRDWVIANVLNGSTIPRPPGYQQPVSRKQLNHHALAQVVELRRPRDRGLRALRDTGLRADVAAILGEFREEHDWQPGMEWDPYTASYGSPWMSLAPTGTA